jgi:hypothetical protein
MWEHGAVWPRSLTRFFRRRKRDAEVILLVGRRFMANFDGVPEAQKISYLLQRMGHRMAETGRYGSANLLTRAADLLADPYQDHRAPTSDAEELRTTEHIGADLSGHAKELDELTRFIGGESSE